MRHKKVNYSDLSEVLNDAASYKQKTAFLADLFDGGDDSFLQERGQKMRVCGTLVDIGFDSDRFHLTGANFCRQRLCPMCQYRRSVKLGQRAREVFDNLTEDGFAFLHMVLTVRNIDENGLPALLGKMNRAFSRMLKDERLRAFKGALRFTEVTYSEKWGNFHPHFHCLIAVKQSYFKSRFYVKQETVFQLWKEYMQLDYEPSCHISKADSAAVAEVCKYCVKPFDTAVKDRDELRWIFGVFDRCLGGRRMLQSYGVLKGAMSNAIKELENDTEYNSSTLDFLGTFQYNFNQGGYFQV